jgi:multiple sugar transport system permease protein
MTAFGSTLSAQRRTRVRPARVLFHIALVILLLVVLYPGIWLLMAAFQPSAKILAGDTFGLGDLTIENFVSAFEGIGGIGFPTYLWNSIVLAVLSVVGIVASSAMSAYAFARIQFRGRTLWFTLMIGTLLLPFHVLIIPQYILFQKVGLVDTYVPLLLGKFLATEAFFVFLMVQFIRNIPREMDEAAVIDGAGHFRIFTSVIFPLMRPAVITSSIFAFIWSWNDFLGPLLYINSPEKYPLPLALRLFVDRTSVSDYGAMMAMSVLALLPVILFFVVFQRYIVSGVATQGLKG